MMFLKQSAVSLIPIFLASIYTVVQAVPIAQAASSTVTVVPNLIRSQKNGHSAYLKSLSKYKGASELMTMVSTARNSSVGAEPAEYDSEYNCLGMIGNQNFALNLDTGSSDLWVLGMQLEGQAGSGHSYYQPSSTATRDASERWSIGYGDGSSASGIVFSDMVTLGSITVTNQAVEVATRASSSIISDPASDGILGLGFDSINSAYPQMVTTFLTNAIAQGLPQALFTASLKHEAVGTYTFGAIPSDEFTGSITYTTVDNSDGYWMFSANGLAVGSGFVIEYQMTGIADTGTSLLLIDTAVAFYYYSQVSGAEYYDGSFIFPCESTLPDFTVVINGYDAVVPGDYINYAPIGDDMCYGGIQTNQGIGFSIFGDIFLKSVFVVFDRTTYPPRLGFATQA